MLQPVKRIFPLLLTFLIALSTASFMNPGKTNAGEISRDEKTGPVYTGLYHNLELDKLGLNRTAYELAVKGWEKLKRSGSVSKEIVTICDFTKPANERRLFIIDMKEGKLLFNTLVAHGKNTGELFAQSFSNEPSSLKSSLGFYITKETYNGKHGLSLKLAGQEQGINDKAEERAIVMHGADYVADQFASMHGRIGRSFGCPAVPNELTEPIINCVKGGSCLFIFYPDANYLKVSQFVK